MLRMKSASGSYIAYTSEVYEVPYEDESDIFVIGQAQDATATIELFGRSSSQGDWASLGSFTGDFTALVPLWARHLYVEVDDQSTGTQTTCKLTRGKPYESDVDGTTYTVNGTIGFDVPVYQDFSGVNPPPISFRASISDRVKPSPLWLALFGPGGSGGVQPTNPVGVPQAVIADAFVDDWHAKQFLHRAQGRIPRPEVDAAKSVGISQYVRSQVETPGYDFFTPSRDRRVIDNQGYDFEVNMGVSAAVDSAPGRTRFAEVLQEFLAINLDEVGTQSWDRSSFVQMYHDRAFTTYGDLIKGIAEHPAMGEFLSHHNNVAAGVVSGVVPDENFAREVMQLFTVGLEELTSGGLRIANGSEYVLNYTQTDVQEAARVFTGLYWPFGTTALGGYLQGGVYQTDGGNGVGAATALDISTVAWDPTYHDAGEKTIIDLTIPAGMEPSAQMDMFLDYLVEANTSTRYYVAVRVLKEMGTMNPSEDCVNRVAAAFVEGEYILPDGSTIGSGSFGDLAALYAAVLCDEEVNFPETYIGNGKDPSYSGLIMDPWQVQILLYGTGYRQSLAGQRHIWAPDTADRDWAWGHYETIGLCPWRARRGVFGNKDPYSAPINSTLQSDGYTAPVLPLWTELGYGNVMFELSNIIGDAGNSSPLGNANLDFATPDDARQWAYDNNVPGISTFAGGKVHEYDDGVWGVCFVCVEGIFDDVEAAYQQAVADGGTDDQTQYAAALAAVQSFEREFFRHPLSTEERENIARAAEYDSGAPARKHWRDRTAQERIEWVRVILQLAMQSPQFLYT